MQMLHVYNACHKYSSGLGAHIFFYSNCNMNLKRYTMTRMWTKSTYFSCWILHSKQYMHIIVELTMSAWPFDEIGP